MCLPVSHRPQHHCANQKAGHVDGLRCFDQTASVTHQVELLTGRETSETRTAGTVLLLRLCSTNTVHTPFKVQSAAQDPMEALSGQWGRAQMLG